MNLEYTEAFPVEWTAWRELWRTWAHERRHDLQPTSYRLKGKNFMADEVLGVWRIDTRTGPRPTELSEVTFRFGAHTSRYVGITYGQASGHESGGIARSFAELEHLLGLGDWRSCDECGLIAQASDFPDWPDGVCPNCVEHSRWRTEVVFEGALEDTDHYDTREQAEARFEEHVDELHRDHSASHWRVDIYDEGDGLNPGQPVQSLVHDPEEEHA